MTMLLSLLLMTEASATVVQLGEEEEVELALSAAPEHLREGAGVYRLGERGYRQVRMSKNGFDCLVAREPALGIAPVCYDVEGSRTNMQADMLRGSLRRQGKSEAEIAAELSKAYAEGRLKAPSRPGIAYMLSANFTEIDKDTGKRRCVFPPHVMFYAPYAKNSDIGAERKHFGSTHQPWILDEGEPGAHILVVSHGVDVKTCR